MEYPQYRFRVAADGSTTTCFYFMEAGKILKFKADDFSYIYVGTCNNNETEQQLVNSTTALGVDDYAADCEDIANTTLGLRVGSTPIIRSH